MVCGCGWQDYAAVSAAQLTHAGPADPLTYLLNAF
jgi:hypothetical protein